MSFGGGAQARGSASDRNVRNLMNLKASGSSSRTLNLLSVWEKDHSSVEWRTAPFFRSPVLNKSIIVKHRLRKDEYNLFHEPRGAATKVILPINLADLRSGGRSFFVGQRGYETILSEISVDPNGREHDRQLLTLLEGLPSLDPFLMRERLKKAGYVPARCYFDITEADTAKMFEFTRREITPLIGLTFEDLDAGVNEKISKLATKILNNAGDSELEPLRQGLGLDRLAFEEGIFSWKGFIYYKWSLINLAPSVKPVSIEIAQIRPTGPSTEEETQYILASRARLSKAIAQACDTVRNTLKIYDDAYAELTQCGQPTAFKEFLLDAPGLFHELGERVGAVQHIVSFWRFRFKPGVRPKIASEELHELLGDFEQSLSFGPSEALSAA